MKKSLEKMAFQITGKIEVIGAITPITTKSGQTIYRREFVIDATRYNPDTGEPWENHPKFEIGGQNVNMLDQFQVGQRVTVDFSLRGAKYPDQNTGEIKYFTSINAFKVALAERSGQQNSYQSPAAPTYQQPAQQMQAQQPFPPQIDENGAPIGNDDLPF